MNDLLSTLVGILAELGLPEPEVNFEIPSTGGSKTVLLAWPEQHVAIRNGHMPGSSVDGEWTIWECSDEVSGRIALRAIGDCLHVEANVLRLDFTRVQGLLDAGQYDAARDAVDLLQNDQIQRDHPDWATCEAYRKKTRIAAHTVRTTTAQRQPPLPRLSLPAQIRKDAEHVMPAQGHEYNLMGFFSPEDETLGVVDAVWLVQVRESEMSVWTACIQGNPAYEADTNWQPVGTEGEMLDELLERLGGKATFVWRAERMLPLLRQWHYRVKGVFVSGVQLLDLELISQVAYPMAHRTDSPESLCTSLKLEFRDSMGLGGPLAAMLEIIREASARLGSLPDAQRAALRAALSFKPSREENPLALEGGVPTSDWQVALPSEWLDFFIPAVTIQGCDKYLELLHEHFESLPATIQKSDGCRNTPLLELGEFFKKGGFLSRAAGFEYAERAAQIGFGQRIQECISDVRPYVLEAGTGIGKTIGYLVPCLLSAKRTFVSTQTKSLQDQAWAKDVPMVLKAFSLAGVERTVAIMKGKGNYVCLQTVADMLETIGESVETAEDSFFLATLVDWLMETRTGWLSEIEHLGERRMASLLGRDLAPPKLRSGWADVDPHALARDAAAKADLVLVNHSYVFALANTNDAVKNGIETLVFDEAHNVEAVVTEVLTLHLRPWALLHELQSVLKRDKHGKAQGLYRSLLRNPQITENRSVSRFVQAMETYEQDLATWCDRARRRLNDMYPQAEDLDPDYPRLFESSDFWVESLYTAARDLRELMSATSSAAHDLLESLSSIASLPRRLSGSLGSLESHLDDGIAALDDLFEVKADRVHFGEAQVKTDAHGLPMRDGTLTAWTAELHSTPLDIAGWLEQHVNAQYEHRAYVSATLSVGGGFEAIRKQLGLSAEDDQLKPVTGIYQSPFDYWKQALLAVPTDIPLANPALKIDPHYMEGQSRHIADEAIASEGRMLVLFTSNLIMREMAPRLRARLNDHGIVVLTQSDANRAALVDRLRDAQRSGEKIVLLGVRSFWEGIDVSGAALSVLVVTRLPFEYQGNPVARAKRIFYESTGHDRDYFRDCVVPAATLHLRQMYGRLIRSEDDRGATVITDQRICSRQYGRAMLRSLPETTTVVDKCPVVVDAVQRFLRGETVESSYLCGGFLPIVSDELSPEQRDIVECPSKRILVRASAGSGKTHVLTSRLVRLVGSDYAKPEDTLALTYTNKAVDVMYDRIEATLGSARAYQMQRNVLTYHKLAMRIIRQDDIEQGDQTEFIDEKKPELQQEFFARARCKAGITAEELNDDDARTLIGYAQNGLVDEAELEAGIPALERTQPLMAKFARFFLTYVGLLREGGLIDYGEAIVSAVRILRENEEQAKRWANRFKWIFCDEYQDTSPAQAMLLQLLGQQANLFVVGDNNQSIYSWQGTDPDNLRQFEVDFPNTTTFNLSKNFRCFPKLVRMSVRFLERAGETGGVHIEYDEKRSTEEQSVYFLRSSDDRIEATSLAALVKTALAIEVPGYPPRPATVGILARKWQLLETVESELIREGIPYAFEGETARGILASQRVRELIVRAADLWSKQIAGYEFGDSLEGRVGLGLRQGHFKTADAFLRAVRDAQPREGLTGKDAIDFDRLCTLLCDSEPSIVGGLFAAGSTTSHVVLSTVHSQKGEEFDTVVVLGLEEGNSPHEQPEAHARLLDWRKIVQRMSRATWRSDVTNDDLQRLYDQEEKRIFYVAMTRARFNLVISHADERVVYCRKRQYKESSFLDLSNDPRFVSEAASSYDVKIAAPAAPKAETGYRSDGRVYQTKSGILVRSKSEMLLANEFTSRGMYFEYEEPVDNVRDALPDFTFSDYGNVILEHLGLMPDPDYLERWQSKAREYEKQGIQYFQTNENEMHDVSGTVDRLQDQFRSWVEQRSGIGRVRLIDVLEEIRRISRLQIGHPLGSFEDGVFDVADDPQIIAIALCKEGLSEEMLSPGAATLSLPPALDQVHGEPVSWSTDIVGKAALWTARRRS